MTIAASREKSGAFTIKRPLLWAAMFPLIILFLLNIFHVAEYIALALRYPFELDYGEGIVWQQMRNIWAGEGYSPIGVYPAIVYHYPPLYHVTVGAIAQLLGFDELYTGRAVSIFCTALMSILCGVLSTRLLKTDDPASVKIICGVIGGSLILSCNPVLVWFMLMRVDMLCHALTLIGLLLTIRSVGHPSEAFLAGLAFTLAIFTKQTAVAGPAAALIMLSIVAPRQAVYMLSACLLTGLPAATWLFLSTDGEFFRHILLYNVNRLDWNQAALLLSELRIHLLLIMAASLAAWVASLRLIRLSKGHDGASWITRVRKDRSCYSAFLLLIFLVITTCMLPMIMKSGAYRNYLIEWFCALSIFAGAAFRPMARFMAGSDPKIPAFAGAIFIVGLPLQVSNITRWDAALQNARFLAHEADVRPVMDIIRRSSKPVVGDPMAVIMRSGQAVEWEPAIAAELGHAGIYDEHAFIAMIRQRRFGFFITDAARGSRLYDNRYNQAVADAMDAVYSRKIKYAGMTFHFPASRSATIPPAQQTQP